MEPKNELDRQLEDLLAQYGNAEPRPGLENRVIARLRQEQTRLIPSWIRQGLLTASVGVAVAVFAVVFLLQHFNNTHQLSTDQRQASSSTPITSSRGVKSRGENAQEDPLTVPDPPVRRVKIVHAAKPLPKLGVFPSNDSLTEQERVLLRYIKENPEHASLVARAQMVQMHKDTAEQGQWNDKDLSDPMSAR